ncbi:MAG TPA: cyclic nucleotide-binding domain-containing protein [Candidatus Methylomirabilis sp.]|nr:cyclic nucleotide-binding domain-containing protein [Candidatus Methylomirabilis sp.]
MEQLNEQHSILAPRPLGGIWLNAGPVHASIESLVLDMLEPNFPNPVLRRAAIEELARGVKLADVVVESLGLRAVAIDEPGGLASRVVAAQLSRDPWREALVAPGGDRPIGLLIHTADAGPLLLVHEVFTRFSEPEKDWVRRYAALALRGAPHEKIVETLNADPASLDALTTAGRTVQLLDPAVLFSPDGRTRVQLGSPSQTTKDILREGLRGDQIFILPATLFEGRTNYGDVEFLVYLNFFLREQTRTRIVGSARQQDILYRILTLTLFGLFDPSAPEPASFEQVREAYGVDSRETYEFLRLAHELYGTRRGPEAGSPLLGIDDYVDFVTLELGETVIALPSAEVRVTTRGRAFHVRIVQQDGRDTAKDLEVSPARRRVRAIPPLLREAIQFATDRPRFGVTPLGTSHGFDPGGDFTSFVVWINGRGILVDPSPEALAYLDRIGVAPVDVPYVLLTHVHSDHDGGLIEKLLSGSRTTVIAADPVFRAFTEKARLVTGHDFAREGLVEHIRANPGTRVRVPVAGEFAEITTRWNLHPIPTTGFKVSFAGRTFGYSGDTQYEPALLESLRKSGRLSPGHFDDLMYFLWTKDGRPTVDFLYHEAGIPPIHTDKERLRILPEAVTSRTSLVHIADRDVPDGFVPGKPRLFETRALVPLTARSQARLLLDTMRLVAYLYDVPDETLETLLRAGDVVKHPADTVIVHKGPVGANEPLHFHIVTDGRVNVRDGRRVIATLAKADTFGEWGISHQRGFRAADVVAEHPSQTIQLGEESYRWLVAKHPIIQDRLSTIRTLLPRLQLAQGRARLKSGTQPGGHSVIEGMSTSQLSSLAIFSTVHTFKHGQPVMVRADEVDGFYVLLSGHLVVGLNGRIVSELSEGDIFGEQGLLEGGADHVDVTATSVDAEALFVTARSLQRLLRTVPTFGWGIWETVAGRRESRRIPPERLPDLD